MKYALVLILATSSCAYATYAQDTARAGEVYQSGGVAISGGTGVVTTAIGARAFGGTPVQGAPYSATITNESLQTLGDGTSLR
jgi:hypothetical protein